MPHCVHCGREVSAETRYCPACGKPARGGGTTRSGVSPAVWIVVGAGCLAAVVVFVGIVAALFVPNFLDALQKARQKRTMADMRILGVAIESYRVETGEVPPADSVSGLAEHLVPEYVDPESLEAADAWENPIRYVCWSEEPAVAGCTAYRLVSGGRDGVLDGEPRSYREEEAFTPTDYDRDLVYGDGRFLRYPQLGR